MFDDASLLEGQLVVVDDLFPSLLVDFEELLKNVSLLELLCLLLFLLFVTLGREDKAEAYFILYAQIVLNGLSELLDFLRW